MKPYKIFQLLAMPVIIITFPWITSCTHDAKISDYPEICFTRDVLPIFQNNCAISRCHDGGGGESGRALDNYTSISRTVVPRNTGASSSYKAIIATWGENKMPPSQPLSLENRIIIRLWIEQGAGLTTCPTNSGTGQGIITGINYNSSNDY
jgi:hypothetical protein